VVGVVTPSDMTSEAVQVPPTGVQPEETVSVPPPPESVAPTKPTGVPPQPVRVTCTTVPCGPEQGEQDTETDWPSTEREERQVKKKDITVTLKIFGADFMAVLHSLSRNPDFEMQCAERPRKLS
jgi:hypothetical protein